MRGLVHGAWMGWGALIIFMGAIAGCASTPNRGSQPVASEACGVEIQSLRVTAAGGFLDLRFRVLEPEKAATFLDPSVPASLLHEPTGRLLSVASSKIGKLRQHTSSPERGREYFMLFRNSAGMVAPGDRVILMAGPCRIEGLEVQ
jgi:hypothetical protein